MGAMSTSPSERIVATATAWPGVTTAHGSRGELSIRARQARDRPPARRPRRALRVPQGRLARAARPGPGRPAPGVPRPGGLGGAADRRPTPTSTTSSRSCGSTTTAPSSATGCPPSARRASCAHGARDDRHLAHQPAGHRDGAAARRAGVRHPLAGRQPGRGGDARVPRGDVRDDDRDRHPQRLAARARRRRRAVRRAWRATFPGRFLLGIGIGHPEATSEYRKPLATMRAFLDGLDAAPRPVPRDAADRRRARPEDARAGGGALARHAPVLRPRRAHADRAGRGRAGRGRRHRGRGRGRARRRDRARRWRASTRRRYLASSNYTKNLERLGYTEAEFADGGSDRLIDAVVPHGSAEAIADVVRAHLDAGADHVCLQPVGHGPDPEDDYRALAAALL